MLMAHAPWVGLLFKFQNSALTAPDRLATGMYGNFSTADCADFTDNPPPVVLPYPPKIAILKLLYPR
jgi:hypothetical protein